MAVVVCGAILMAPAASLAAQAEVKRGELSDLKDKIGALRDDLARTEESHDEAVDQLAASDRAISSAQRRLREITQRRAAAEQEYAQLEQRRTALAARMQQTRRALGDTLFRIYIEGGRAGTRRLLSGDEPNELARDAYYLELIAGKRMAAIEATRSALAQMNEVVTQAQARKDELQSLEAEQRQEQDTLLAERKKQRTVLGDIASQLRGQRREIATLQHDETRMEKLVVGLEKIGRETPPRKTPPNNASKPVPAASSSVALANSAAAASHPARSAEEAPRGAERVVEPKPAPSVTTTPPPAQEAAPVVSTDFPGLRGHLPWPVKGELRGRFGAPRAEGGAVWRGIFIRSSAGQDVHVVARGKVAFADWLRGFGNLIIVDHGDGYMTVYGNNESLFKNPGDEVRAGEVIASVGASGGLEESGLYFEIRYRGQAQDPAKWTGQSR